MKTSQMADKILIALVRVYERSQAILTEPGFGLDIWDLAEEASIIDKYEAANRRKYFLSGSGFFSGGMENFPGITASLRKRGWIETHEFGGYGKDSVALYPTLEGIDHAHWLMRPWYKKIAGYLSKYLIQITVSVITAAVTTLVTYFILEWIR